MPPIDSGADLRGWGVQGGRCRVPAGNEGLPQRRS